MKESTLDWLDRSKSWKQQVHEQRQAEEKKYAQERREGLFHNAEK